MSTIPYDESRPDWETDDYDDAIPPRRPRRTLWNRATGTLLAAIACAAAFYAGVRVEKGQASASSSASGVTLPAGLRRAAAGSGTGARIGFAGAAGPGGPAAAGAPGAAGGAGATFGTVASVKGQTIDVTDTAGNTVKVTLSSATRVTKSLRVSRHSLRPGDTVVVQGVTGARGAVAAASISDSGAGSARATSGGGGSTGSGGGGAVSSLFGGGG